MGGPYASQDDATRAIERGGFAQSAADLIVVPGGADDDDDDSGKTASKTATFPPGDSPADDAEADAADDGEGLAPDLTDDDQAPEVTGAPPEQQTGVFPITTKPSQTPIGAGPLQSAPAPPGGMALMPGGAALPPMPGSPQFAPGGMEQADVSGLDPVAQQIDTVAALVAQDNPTMDSESIQRVARATVGRYLATSTPNNPTLIPTIEDPLKDTSPLAREKARANEVVTQDQQPADDLGDEAKNTAEQAGASAAGRAVMRTLPKLMV